jgi:hypothetical protein
MTCADINSTEFENSHKHFEANSVFKIAYPFVKSTYTEHDGENFYEAPCWKPGVRGELVYPDDSKNVADAMGYQILTIIDIHKPGKYPARVFYIRQWQDPNGIIWGKTNLRIKSLSAFKRDTKGYRYNDYELAKQEAA